MSETKSICSTPADTFAFGESIGRELKAGDAVLLSGGLGVGKTLLTKGILNALDFDIDEVTSPSFTLVNLYNTENFDVFHIDLWRIAKGSDAAFSVGLEEILENDNSVVVIEWADRLNYDRFGSRVLDISIKGEGDDAREINVEIA